VYRVYHVYKINKRERKRTRTECRVSGNVAAVKMWISLVYTHNIGSAFRRWKWPVHFTNQLTKSP